ncbi:MAG: hypothetical protein ACR2NN_00560 [Bryobacteraceae bacterium]
MTRFFVVLAPLMAAGMAAEIPVREVILYKSGVGYFERAGDLRPGESARLDFKATDMNDVLKSLTVGEKGGSKIAGLRYDSSEPLAQKLAEFPFHVDGPQPLSAFLEQLRGARIEMKYGSETVVGTVVSARLAPASEKTAEREQVILMLDSGELRTFDLAAASSIRFADPKLQLQLKDYLAAVNQSRSMDKRSVYIDSSDAKDRQIVASYMVPMPVWKSSYRLIFADQGEPTLEGWAIIDNTTGEDWTKVRLAVVSGRPVSFISSLYEPKFLQRATVDLPEDQAARPVVHEGAIDAVTGSPRIAKSRGVPGGVIGGVPSAGFAAQQMQVRENQESTIAADAQGRDLGDLFEYSFSGPITIKKSESAMLPFLQQKLGARKLLIYAQSYGQHPMSAAELTNSTGKTLDGGPITVFDSNSYAGEALVETVRPGDKRLISYAVDLGTRITTQFDSSHDYVREIHVNRGTLTTRSAVQETKTYTIRNVDAKAKTLLIEHAERPGYKLLNEKPTETTSNAYRFEVKLAPNATEKFPVSEERVYDNSFAVSSLSPSNLLVYVQNKAIPDNARRQLQKILDQKRQIAANDEEIRATENEQNEAIRDQERIRQNIISLNNVNGQSEQVQTYSRQLAAQEKQLAAIRDRLSEGRKKKTSLEAGLRTLIESLEF